MLVNNFNSSFNSIRTENSSKNRAEWRNILAILTEMLVP